MKKNRILISILITLIVAFSVILGIGNYFVNYAITRGAEGSQRNVEPIYEESSAIEKTKAANEEKESIHVEEWLKLCKKSSVSIQSEDGLTLAANEYIASEDSHKWAILVHGYTSKKETMEGIGEKYWQNGFHILAPDMRAHGESEGKYIGMGWLEKNDLLLWIRWILDKDIDAEIVMHGVSMGAATVMMAAGEELPEQVKAAIEDCGYTSVWDIFASELKTRFNLPTFPALDSAQFVASIRAGYNFKEASALEQVKKSKLPMLFIHGSQDDFVPTSMVYPLYEASTNKKDILIIENAGHSEAKIVDPELYYNTVFQFIGNIIDL